MENHDDNPQEPEEKPIENPAKNKRLKKLLLLPARFKTPLVQRLFQKKWTRFAAAAVIAVPLVGILAWWGWSGSSLSKLGVDAAIVEGTVQYRLDYDQPWEKAQEGMSFGEGAQVRAGADSRAVLNIDDGSAVRLNSDSSVVLTKLTAKHIIIQNTGGDVYTRVVKSDKRIFQVRSGTATYQSEGTAYRTFNTDAKEGVEVYHSKVTILGIKADGTVAVKQGERYYLVNSKATDSEGKVTELSPEELAADEFVKWNSEQDKKDFAKELGILFDLSPPALEISSPANGITTEASSIEVAGTAEKGAKILVNGTETANNDGQFTASVGLNEGANGIKVEASDSAGNKTVKNLTVTRSTPPAVPTTSFKLVGTKVDKGVSFTWNISGITVTKGFKIVKSTSANPTYSSKSDYAYVESSSVRSYTWKIQDGKTYHFRICTYNGSTCTNYSNDITVTTPPKPVTTAPTGSITLSGTGGSSPYSNPLSWSVSGGSALYGFKLVWSTSSGPTYPGALYKEFYEQNSTGGSITGASGNYYVRICMYHDGSCINYSNELYVNVP